MMVSLGDGISLIASVRPMTNDNATNNIFQSARPVIPVIHEDYIKQSDNASQTDTFSALLREADSKLHNGQGPIFWPGISVSLPGCLI